MLTIAICDDEKKICDYIESRTTEFLAKNDFFSRRKFLPKNSVVLYCVKSINNNMRVGA